MNETRALIEAEKNTTIAPPVSASSVPINIGRGEPTSNSDSIIAAQKEKDLSEIKDNEKFKQLSKAITEREIGYKLQENALTIQGKEFQNQYDEYVLKKKKRSVGVPNKKRTQYRFSTSKSRIKRGETQNIRKTVRLPL